jgi:hypothetical protein
MDNRHSGQFTRSDKPFCNLSIFWESQNVLFNIKKSVTMLSLRFDLFKHTNALETQI